MPGHKDVPRPIECDNAKNAQNTRAACPVRLEYVVRDSVPAEDAVVIRFKCGGCGKQYNVQPEMAGKQARCKQCGATFQVPTPRPAAGDAAATTRAAGGQARPPAKPARPAASAPQRPKASPRTGAAGGRPAAPSAARAAPPKQVAPEADPLGLGVDLDALGPLGNPGLGNTAAGPALGAGAPLSLGGYRPRKKSNLGLWLLLGGGGVALVGMVVGVVVLVVNNLPAKSAVAANVDAYLPTTWSAAASIRVRPLIEWSSKLPALKAQLDKGLAGAQASGLDFRKVDEVLVVADGKVFVVAMTFAEPVDIVQLLKSDRPLETHRGLQLYEGGHISPPTIPGAMPSGSQAPQKMYSMSPSDKLIVGSNDLARLKAGIDQALDGRGAKLDLPRQKAITFRVKNIKDLMGGTAMPPNPMTDGIVGGTASVDLAKDLNLEAILDMKDAAAATNLHSQLNGLLMLAKMQLPAEAQSLVDSLKMTPSGSKLQFNVSVPSDLIAKASAGGPMPMGGIPGQPPMGGMPGQPPMGGFPGQPMPGR